MITAQTFSRLRALRPLLWWICFVLVLYAYKKHEYWIDRTRVEFDASLEGKPIPFEVSAAVDGKVVSSGERISLGTHTITISNRKAENFTTNIFVWYGGINLGKVNLKRRMGKLNLDILPEALSVSIVGPEFSRTFSNSRGMTSSVPTDRYEITVKHEHWHERREVAVEHGLTSTVHVAPKFGILDLSCNQASATFALTTLQNETILESFFPRTVTQLPEGMYKVIARHKTRESERTPVIKVGTTNSLRIDFDYGAVILESTPPGASVAQSDGQFLGITPIQVSEIIPGSWRFVMRKDGFEPINGVLQINANGTNRFATSLTNSSYLGAIGRARQSFAAGNYVDALSAANEALLINPSDNQALTLQIASRGREHVRKAQIISQTSNYTGAFQELSEAFKDLPNDEMGRALWTSMKAREQEELQKASVERLARPKAAFELLCVQFRDSANFESHELKTVKSTKTVVDSLGKEIELLPIAFQSKKLEFPKPGTFTMVIDHSFTGGFRRILIAGGQSRDDETQVYFKVVEYKIEAANKFSIGNLINRPVEVIRVLIDPRKLESTDKLNTQIADGLSLATGLIGKACK